MKDLFWSSSGNSRASENVGEMLNEHQKQEDATSSSWRAGSVSVGGPVALDDGVFPSFPEFSLS